MIGLRSDSSSSLLQSLTIQDFRCLEGLSWSPGPGQHVLVGSNGVGKTSVLEAVYFLATTKSFRTASLADCLRWRQREFWVRGQLVGERGAELLASWKTGGTARQLNGKSATFGEYLGRVSALSWSAKDDRLIDGDPASRRRLLDQGVFAKKPLEVGLLTRYRRVLTAKRRLLSKAGNAAVDSLESWNELLAEAGHALVRLRAEHVAELGAAFDQVLRESGIEARPVEFRYRPNPEKGVESVESFRRELALAGERELAQKRALVGPHLDRLEIRWGGADIARSASAGERKLFGLVLTAARRRVLLAAGREPILLLDDLDAALDQDRLESVWRLFESAPQVLMTSADPGTGGRIRGVSRWHMHGSGIEPL